MSFLGIIFHFYHHLFITGHYRSTLSAPVHEDLAVTLVSRDLRIPLSLFPLHSVAQEKKRKKNNKPLKKRFIYVPYKDLLQPLAEEHQLLLSALGMTQKR